MKPPAWSLFLVAILQGATYYFSFRTNTWLHVAKMLVFTVEAFCGFKDWKSGIGQQAASNEPLLVVSFFLECTACNTYHGHWCIERDDNGSFTGYALAEIVMLALNFTLGSTAVIVMVVLAIVSDQHQPEPSILRVCCRKALRILGQNEQYPKRSGLDFGNTINVHMQILVHAKELRKTEPFSLFLVVV